MTDHAIATTIAPHLTVREGLARYLDDNGFTVEAYTAPTFAIEAAGTSFTLANRPWRKRAIPLHDLHHVATGYGTDLAGEAEVSAWEIRFVSQPRALFLLIFIGLLGGLLIAPLRTVRAWRAARGCRALYRDTIAYEDLLKMTVGELRARLGIPAGGMADRPARLHAAARRWRGSEGGQDPRGAASSR